MKFNKKAIAIILITIILVLGIVLILIFGNKHANIKIYNNDKKKLTPEEIIDLITYIPFSYFNWDNYYNAYHGEKVTSEDIQPMILSTIFIDKVINGYNNENIENIEIKNMIDENNIENEVFLNTDINNYLMRRYNLNLNLIKDVSDKINIINLGDKYTAFSSINAGKLTYALKDLIVVNDNYITSTEAIISEKVLFYNIKNDKYYVYKNTNFTDDSNIVKIYDNIDENGKVLENKDIDEKIKEDFKEYKGEFIHTFKKNDTGYYWYSTEFVE